MRMKTRLAGVTWIRYSRYPLYLFLKFSVFVLLFSTGAGISALLCSCSLPTQVSNTKIDESLSSQISGRQEKMEHGVICFEHGDFEKAILNWETAARLYEDEGDTEGAVDAHIRLSQAYHLIGQLDESLEELEKAFSAAKESGHEDQVAAVLGYLGNIYLSLGQAGMAGQYLNEGLVKARDLENSTLEASILNNLGNLFVSQRQYADALDAQMESVKLAKERGNYSLAATGLTNGAMTAIRVGDYVKAPLLLGSALDSIRKIEDSYYKAYGLINIGLAYRDLVRHFPGNEEVYFNLAFEILNEALIISEKIGDLRTQSYALGYLAKVYEDEGQFQDALQLTRRAVFAAQKVNASESLYRWHWQTGQILKSLAKIDEAIEAYRQALYTLQTIREEMATCYANPESTFRSTATAMCSELVDLLLQKASVLTESDECEPLLLEARETLELLKVFELRDYFKDDCVDAARFVETRLETISVKTLVIYPIVLPDRMEVLVSLPEGLRRHSVRVGADAVTQEVRALRKKVEKRTTREFLPHAQRLYDWLIRPIESELAPLSIDTMIFVPDGSLRTIPMAVLHDGEHFLVEKYAIGITPGLNLVDPHPIQMEETQILTLGLTESVQGFPSLPYVSQELNSIHSLYESHGFLDNDFILANMEHELKHNPYNIVHIASHGQFGTDVKDTFVLAFDGRLTMERLGEYVGLFQFRDDPLELLTLSACETAAGDERAALGLAGVAIRTGARSALATLWHVNDPASSRLVTEFYRQLREPSISRVIALQAAQLELINDPRYDHPGYWSPFLLINNWL